MLFIVTFDEKKDHVLMAIQLGMDLYSACVTATCTDEEIQELEADEDFNKRILFEQKKEELAMLRNHATAREIACGKGNAQPTQWMLEHVHPERWGKTAQPIDITDLPSVVILTGKAPESNDDNGSL